MELFSFQSGHCELRVEIKGFFFACQALNHLLFKLIAQRNGQSLCVEQGHPKARGLCGKAAKQEHKEAQFNLGVLSLVW